MASFAFFLGGRGGYKQTSKSEEIYATYWMLGIAWSCLLDVAARSSSSATNAILSMLGLSLEGATASIIIAMLLYCL